jgi:hypothetical protein
MLNHGILTRIVHRLISNSIALHITHIQPCSWSVSAVWRNKVISLDGMNTTQQFVFNIIYEGHLINYSFNPRRTYPSDVFHRLVIIS